MLKLLALSLLIMPLSLWAQVPDRAEDTHPIGVDSLWPDVSLRALDGEALSSHDALQGKPAVVVFFRGGWCPYCNRQLGALRKITGELSEMGYQLIAVSPDRPAALQDDIEKNELDYRLLSDSSAALIKALAIAFRVDAATREKYHGYGIDLEQASGETHHLLPVPSVYIVDAQNTIRYQYSNPDYKVRLDNEGLLQAARAALK